MTSDLLPMLDQEAFSKIDCNRCGACCETFRPNNHWNSAHDGPLGVLEAYGWYETYGQSMGMISDDNFETMVFFGQLEVVEWEGQQQIHYRCGFFERDIEGNGVCTNYENRPPMCSNFPYGPETWNEERKHGEESVVGDMFGKCSWNVRWLDFEVVQ